MAQHALPHSETTRDIIAANVMAELARRRYSIRAAALALGLKPLYLYRRINGEVEFGGSDLAALADLLDINPGVFFIDNTDRPERAKLQPTD